MSREALRSGRTRQLILPRALRCPSPAARSQVPIGAPAVARRAADEWRSMSDSAKEPYTSAAARQIAERPAKLAEWEASLTAQDRARIAAYNRHLGKVGGKNQIKITRDPKRPVKPATAFMRFLSAKREEYDQEGVGRGVPQARKAGEEWNRLGEEAKKVRRAGALRTSVAR